MAEEDLEKKISSINYPIPYTQVRVMWVDVVDLIKKFKQNSDAYIDTNDVRFLELANQNSLDILKKLVEIVKILQSKNDKLGLIKIFKDTMRLVREKRRALRLKV